MKRIAIQFFGHLRTFDETYKSFLKNVVSPNAKNGYQVDVFIHTWTERDHSTVSFRNQNGEEINNNLLTKDLINKVEEEYKPKVFIIDNQIDCKDKIFFEKLYNSKKSLKGVVNMTYTIYKSSHARHIYEKEKQIEYEWVIVTRPDIEFLSPFVIDELFKIYKDKNINIPSNSIFYATKIFARAKVNDSRFVGGSDLIYLGRPQDINKATNLFEYWKKENNYSDIIWYEDFYSPESWLIKYWEKQNLKPIEIDYVTNRDFYPRFNNTKLSFNNFFLKSKKNIFNILKYILPYYLIVWFMKQNN